MTDLRIWDLRRGDDDDNRSCPQGAGLRSLVLSGVFEFNYVKAPVAFLALVIGPALLVGIAPSVLVTYSRLLYHATALAGTRLIVALGLFAVLVGAALWIGRPLLKMAFDNSRHLHYSLVFPIFVALRELLRSVAERFGGPSITPRQLDRRRRVGTVLAALLFAGGGLVLAITAEVSIGLKLVDVEHVRMWPTVKAALGNAAVILGVSTVFESLYWLWRELTLTGPVLDWVAGPAQAASSTLRVAHLSDLHLVGERYGCRMESGTHGPHGNRCFRNALRKLIAIHARNPLDHVLVTGDVTDAGTRAEWAEFIDHLRGCPELRERLSFVPGNHDVNIVDRTNPARLDLPWSAGQALRKLRFVLALDAIQGDRAHLVDRVSGAVGPSLKDYLREGKRPELLRALAQRGAIRGRWEMAKIWNAIFPLVEPAPSEDGCGLILLDSNAPSHVSLTNAIGVVNPSQMNALKSVLRNSPHRAWIILLHHQVVEYPVKSISSLRDRIGLALVNAPDVLAAMAAYASRVLVLHGHRHQDWIGTCGDVILCSAPSVTLGSDDYQGSFHIHELALGADGVIRLTSTQRVKVRDAGLPAMPRAVDQAAHPHKPAARCSSSALALISTLTGIGERHAVATQPISDIHAEAEPRQGWCNFGGFGGGSDQFWRQQPYRLGSVAGYTQGAVQCNGHVPGADHDRVRHLPLSGILCLVEKAAGVRTDSAHRAGSSRDPPQERSALFSIFTIGALGSAITFLIPLYIQVVQGRSGLQTAVAVIPFSLASFAAAVLVVRLYDRLSPRHIARYAFLVVAAGVALLGAVIRNDWSAFMVIVSMFVAGLGEGILLTLLFNVLVTASPKEVAGDVGSLRGATNNLAAGVGI